MGVTRICTMSLYCTCPCGCTRASRNRRSTVKNPNKLVNVYMYQYYHTSPSHFQKIYELKCHIKALAGVFVLSQPDTSYIIHACTITLDWCVWQTQIVRDPQIDLWFVTDPNSVLHIYIQMFSSDHVYYFLLSCKD